MNFVIRSALFVAVTTTSACSMFWQVPSSPLHDAAWRGDVAAVRQLVKDGADVNGTDDMGATALYWAARGGHPPGPHRCEGEDPGRPEVIAALIAAWRRSEHPGSTAARLRPILRMDAALRRAASRTIPVGARDARARRRPEHPQRSRDVGDRGRGRRRRAEGTRRVDREQGIRPAENAPARRLKSKTPPEGGVLCL